MDYLWMARTWEKGIFSTISVEQLLDGERLEIERAGES